MKTQDRAARIDIKLKADSGYTSHVTGRVSAKEWGVINAILNGSYAEARAVLAEIEYTVENIQSCQQE